MRRSLRLLEAPGAAGAPRRTRGLAKAVGADEWAALVAEGIATPTKRATTWECDAIEDGCPRRVVTNEGDAKWPLVAVCGQRPRHCEPVLLKEKDCEQHALQLAALVRVVRRLLAIESPAGAAAAAVGRLAGEVLAPIGAQAWGDEVRDVMLAMRAGDRALGPMLEVRERAARPTLVLVPTATALDAALATRHARGSHVEIAALEELLVARGGKIALRRALAAPARSERGANTTAKRTPPAKSAPPRSALPTIRKFGELHVYKIDEHTVSVHANGTHVRATCFDFGLDDKRSRKPTALWELLMEFLEGNGVYKWKPHGDVRPTKQRLSRLRDALKRTFRLEENPIREYREPDGWRVVFHAYKELPDDRRRPERK